MDGLYWETWYDREQTKLDDKEGGIDILYENRLLGVPRMRQVGVIGVIMSLLLTDINNSSILQSCIFPIDYHLQKSEFCMRNVHFATKRAYDHIETMQISVISTKSCAFLGNIHPTPGS